MRTRHHVPLTLFAGLFFAFAALAPTSTFAQRTAESVDRAPERTQVRNTAKTAETSAPAPKSAHTPATSIENANGNLIFEVSEGGSLLATDQGGAIPAEGGGARMMWYPAKAAFRAGEVGFGSDDDDDLWNDANVGYYSVAFGRDTEASGDRATAMGASTTASALQATAMGTATTASGFSATAMGENTTASASNATAMGVDTEASQPNAVAMGTLAKARGENSLAVGFDALANDSHQLVAGRCNNLSTGYLFVVGNGPLNSAGDGCDTFSDALTLDTSGNMTIAGSLTENSDRRLKTDIEPLGEEVLGALQEIDPVRFRFEDERTHPAGPQIGLIAQEVQKEFPELVTEGNDGMLSLSYTKFSAVLLKGLQEQQAQLDEKTEKIADLNAELEAVSNQQEKLKQRLAKLEAQTDRGSILAGWTGSGFLALLLALGLGLGAGLLWRGRVVVREDESL